MNASRGVEIEVTRPQYRCYGPKSAPQQRAEKPGYPTAGHTEAPAHRGALHKEADCVAEIVPEHRPNDPVTPECPPRRIGAGTL